MSIFYNIFINKSLSRTQVISLFVLPAFIKSSNYLYNVENEYNGVVLQTAFADKQFLLGKGAGGNPTGSAVLSDISALAYDYHYEYKKFKQLDNLTYDAELELDVYYRFTTNEEREQIKFIEIYETFVSINFSYITGKVRLKDLIAVNYLLLDGKGFLALLTDDVIQARNKRVLHNNEAFSLHL